MGRLTGAALLIALAATPARAADDSLARARQLYNQRQFDAAIAAAEQARAGTARDPWAATSGWRMNGALQRTLAFSDEFSQAAGGYQVEIEYRQQGWSIKVGDTSALVRLSESNGADLTLLGDVTVRGSVVRDGETFQVFADGRHHTLHYHDPLAHAGEAEADGGRLTAPMPGKVVAVHVGSGQQVSKGEPLVIMEAMKMEHTIAAPADGVVEEVLYAVGDQVAEGAPLLAFKLG